MLALVPLTYASLDPITSAAIILPSELIFKKVFPKEIVYFDKLVANNRQIKLLDTVGYPSTPIYVSGSFAVFTRMGVTTNTDVTRVRITVQAMSDCPEDAPKQTHVLRCFSVSTFNLGTNEVSSSEISFKVLKELIKANNYSENAVQLRRYSYSWNRDGKLEKWRIAETTLEYESEYYYHYRAISDGFSFFSIVGTYEKEEVNSEIENNEEEINANNEILNEVEILEAAVVEEILQEEPRQVIEEPKIAKNIFAFERISLIAVVLVSVFISLVILPRNTKPKDETPFEQLVSYIRSSNLSEEEIKEKLKEIGWEDQQIDLALNEVRK